MSPVAPPTRVLTYGEDIQPEEVDDLAPIGISGSRTFRALDIVSHWVDLAGPGALIVGDAVGVDTVVMAEAERLGNRTVIVVPFRTGHGKAGGLLRNPDVAIHAREFVAFWSGQPNPHGRRGTVDMGSTGTAHATLWALVYGKPVTIYLPDGQYVTIPAPQRGKGTIIPRRSPLHPAQEPPPLQPPERRGPPPPKRPAALPFT